MQRWQTHFLGREELHDLTPFELRHFFAYSASEKQAIMSRHSDRLRLGAAPQLGFMKVSGRPLGSVDSVSTAVLRHLGETLGTDVPHLASLKTLYNRLPTMFAHQKWARETLGFKDYTPRRERVLVSYLREQAQHRETSEELVTAANTLALRSGMKELFTRSESEATLLVGYFLQRFPEGLAHALYAQGFASGRGDVVEARSLNYLAVVYYSQGKYAEAEELQKRALAIRETALGQKFLHVSVAQSVALEPAYRCENDLSCICSTRPGLELYQQRASHLLPMNQLIENYSSEDAPQAKCV